MTRHHIRHASSRGMSRALLIPVMLCAACANLIICSGAANAGPLPFSTDESQQYLVVARKSINGEVTLTTDNFELGANKAPVPATSGFLAPKIGEPESTGGPSLLGAVPTVPASAQPIEQGIGGNGNLAITDPDGNLNLQDVGVYADPNIGIRIAAPNDSYNLTSGSFFNDPNKFPNTYDENTQTGVIVNADPDGDPLTLNADQSTRIDPTGGGYPSANVGVTFGYDHTALDNELAAARLSISGLLATGTLDVSTGNAGELDTSTTLSGGTITGAAGPNNNLGGKDYTLTFGSGLNVIDIATGSNDFLISLDNMVIDGPDDAFVIFRLLDDDNMLMSQANLLTGNNLGHDKILFFTDQTENDVHFNFDNTLLNGMAFWSLGSSDIAEINVNNSQGCVQFIAEDINLNDVRFTRCSFGVIPEPSTLALFTLAIGSLLGVRRRS